MGDPKRQKYIPVMFDLIEHPEIIRLYFSWIPDHATLVRNDRKGWIPACAKMTISMIGYSLN